MMRLFFICAILLLTGCTAQLEDPPTAPDMDALVRGYLLLTGSVADLTDQEALGLVSEEATRFEQFCEIAPGSTCTESPCGSCAVTQFTSETLTEVVNDVFQPQPNALIVGGDNFSADGYLEIDRICGGEGDVVDREKNGAINLRGTFTEERLEPVFWGGFDGCRQRVLSDNVPWMIDTVVNIHAETPPFEELQQTRAAAESLVPLVVLDLDGAIEREGFVVDVDDDSAINQETGELSLRVNREGRDFLLVLGLQDGSVSLRGGDEEFACSFDLDGCLRVER